MRIKHLSLCLLLLISSISYGQNIDTLSNKLDSLKKQTDTTGQTNQIEPGFYNERTTMNGRVFGILLLNDFKQQALSPFEIKGRGWLRGAGWIAATVALSYADRPVQRWAAGLRRKNEDLGKYSRTVSDIGGVYEVATFAGIATYGFVFKNPKLRTTTALATQAYITSTVWSTIIKTLTGRVRPYSINAGEEEMNKSTFHGPFQELPYGGNGAFPSGHTTLAFAAARVYAMEYRHIKAIPIISYTVAGLIGFSRIIENRHWSTDVFAGAILGWACGTQVVNNYHRYAKIQRTNPKKFKPKASIGATSLNGVVMPQLLVNF